MALIILNDTDDEIYRIDEIEYYKGGNREIQLTGTGYSDYFRLENNRHLTVGLISNGATNYKLEYTILRFKSNFTPTSNNDFHFSGLDQDSPNGGNFSGQMTGFRIYSDGDITIQLKAGI